MTATTSDRWRDGWSGGDMSSARREWRRRRGRGDRAGRAHRHEASRRAAPGTFSRSAKAFQALGVPCASEDARGPDPRLGGMEADLRQGGSAHLPVSERSRRKAEACHPARSCETAREPRRDRVNIMPQGTPDAAPRTWGDEIGPCLPLARGRCPTISRVVGSKNAKAAGDGPFRRSETRDASTVPERPHSAAREPWIGPSGPSLVRRRVSGGSAQAAPALDPVARPARTSAGSLQAVKRAR